MIPYLVPMPMTGDIPGRTRKSIEAQTEPVGIVECRAEGKGREGEAAARKECQRQCGMRNEILPVEYVICADPDRACLDSNDNYKVMVDNVKDARAFLEANKDFGAVSLVEPSRGRDEDDKRIPDIGWVMYRYEVFAALDFTQKPAKGENCLCGIVAKQIRAMGKRFGYMDETTRIMHC